jgi:hypothetical protein
MMGHSLSDHMAALEELERLRARNKELLEALQGLVEGVTVEVEEVALLTDAIAAIAAAKGAG